MALELRAGIDMAKESCQRRGAVWVAIGFACIAIIHWLGPFSSLRRSVNRGDKVPGAIQSLQRPFQGLKVLATPINRAPDPAHLTLIATFPGRNALEGSAVITIDQGEPENYAAGTILPGNTVLAEVYDQYVIVKQSGRSSVLLVQAHGSGNGSAAPSPHLASADLATVARTAGLGGYLRAVPMYEDAKLVGLQILAGANVQKFLHSGLQGEDLITAVNGAPVTDVQEAVKQLEAFVEGAQVVVTVQRGNATRDFVLEGTEDDASAATDRAHEAF